MNRSCREALQHLCSFSSAFLLRTTQVYFNKRLNKGRIQGGSAKIKTTKKCENRQSVKVSSRENYSAYDMYDVHEM